MKHAVTSLFTGCFLCVAAIIGASAHEMEPDRIYNFHAVSEELATAGQVFPEHIPLLQSRGVDMVVNLAVADPERNGGEGLAVTSAGMSYVHIPVDWENPTKADLDLFFAVMDARAERNTVVHCFANYRASAFTYLYRVLREGVPEEEARADLLAIWDDDAFEEYAHWRQFIDEALGAN